MGLCVRGDDGSYCPLGAGHTSAFPAFARLISPFRRRCSAARTRWSNEAARWTSSLPATNAWRLATGATVRRRSLCELWRAWIPPKRHALAEAIQVS